MSSKLSYNKKSMKKTALISMILIFVMMVVQVYEKSKRYEIPKNDPTKEVNASGSEIPFTKQDEKSEKEPKQIIVHIVGEVKSPCVVTIQKGSRLYEAVEKAGGFTETADPQSVNLAQELLDGSQYVIPKKGEQLIIKKGDGSEAVGVASENDGKVDLNAADKEGLKKLPGVGDVLAERIIKHREKIGGFKEVSQLLDVEGIGESKFHSIREEVFVR